MLKLLSSERLNSFLALNHRFNHPFETALSHNCTEYVICILQAIHSCETWQTSRGILHGKNSCTFVSFQSSWKHTNVYALTKNLVKKWTRTNCFVVVKLIYFSDKPKLHS